MGSLDLPGVVTWKGEQLTESDLDNWFSYHAPNGDEQINGYKLIRQAGREFAGVIARWTPASADQTAAIRKIREAVMTANAAIACGGK